MRSIISDAPVLNKLAWIIILLILNKPAMAAPEFQKISLEEARKIALENNQDYKIAAFRLKEAKERVNGAWGQLMPVLESEASALRQHADSGFMSLSDGQYDIKFVQLRFGINPGIFYNSLEMSKKAYQASEEDVRRIRADIENRVIKSYFGLLLAGEMVRLRKDSMELLKSNLKDVENLYKTGSVPRFELLQAQVQLKSQEPLLMEAENNFSLFLDTFNYDLGCDGIVYAADEGVLDNGSYALPAGENQKKIEMLAAIALKNRPEIIQLELNREIQDHSKKIQSAYYIWPTFSIGGYYGITKYMPNPLNTGAPAAAGIDFSQISGSGDWQNTWQIRVAATYRWGAWLPTDTTSASEREEKIKLEEAQESLLKLKRQVVISIRSNYLRLVSSYMTIKSQQDNVTTAQEGLRIAKESYRAGIIKNSDLLSSELALTNAKTSYINAIYSYYTSLSELQKEMGINDERIIMEAEKQ